MEEEVKMIYDSISQFLNVGNPTGVGSMRNMTWAGRLSRLMEVEET